MKRLSAVFMILTLYASYALGAPVPITAPITTTTTIPGNSSLLDDVIEATNARNNLKVVPSSQIGQQLVTSAELSATASLSGFTMGAAGIAGLAYYQRTGKDPVYAAYEAVASAADALFVPAYQAFKANFVSPESFPASAAQYVGAEGSVGATLDDFINYIKSSASDLFPKSKALIASNSSSPTYKIPSSGDIISTQFGLVQLNSNTWSYWTATSLNDPPRSSNGYYLIPGFVDGSGRQYYVTIDKSRIFRFPDGLFRDIYYNVTSVTCTAVPTGTPLSPNPGTINYESLKSALEAANKDAAFADEVRSAISNMPSDQKITSSNPNPTSVPAQQPSPITNNDVSNFFTANTTNIYNEYLNTVNNGGDVNTAQAAAELAQAQEEEAEKETEEKFNQIPTNAFEPPYDPGPFDIPTRFTTFLGNVKSSGLFSFSSAFFDSLPGGGSPLLTVNGGQTFGTHTYDFSQAFSSGLPILKSVLLALFGFLSVRAVIMKR